MEVQNAAELTAREMAIMTVTAAPLPTTVVSDRVGTPVVQRLIESGWLAYDHDSVYAARPASTDALSDPDSPEFIDELRSWARWLAARGHVATAIKLASETPPDSSTAGFLLRYGQDAIAHGGAAATIVAVSRVFSTDLHPSCAPLRFLLASAYAAAGRTADSDECFDHLVANESPATCHDVLSASDTAALDVARNRRRGTIPQRLLTVASSESNAELLRQALFTLLWLGDTKRSLTVAQRALSSDPALSRPDLRALASLVQVLVIIMDGNVHGGARRLNHLRASIMDDVDTTEDPGAHLQTMIAVVEAWCAFCSPIGMYTPFDVSAHVSNEPITGLLAPMVCAFTTAEAGSKDQARGIIDDLLVTQTSPLASWFLGLSLIAGADLAWHADDRASLAEFKDLFTKRGMRAEAALATARLSLGTSGSAGHIRIASRLAADSHSPFLDLRVRALNVERLALTNNAAALAAATDLQRHCSRMGAYHPYRALMGRQPHLAQRTVTTGVGLLTSAEARVFTIIGRGLTAEECAAQLHISPHTVRTHVRHIYAKLGVRRRSQALEAGRRLGYFE